MQTILGAGGAIGDHLAGYLSGYTNKIRLVSRNPEPVDVDVDLFAADLSDPDQADQAIKGSEVVYLIVGLKYELRTWKTLWPKIMANVIVSCKTHHVKLVFFDNVYMYGKVSGQMTEETPVNPSSKKGEIRAIIAKMLMDEVKAGNIKALIARAADFYGPNVANSIPEATIIQNYLKGKKAQLFCSDKYVHSYTYTPDAAKATALLGNSERAYNQIWHLPTYDNPMTGKEWVTAFANAFETKPDYTILKKWMVGVAGIFNPTIGEIYEMLYQNDRDYIFNSSKFEKEFDLKPISYEEGIRRSVQAALQK